MNIQELEEKVRYIKRVTFENVIRAGKGHLGGSMSIADVLVALYYGDILTYSPKKARDANRDRLIMSKGHSNNVLHAILADLGFITQKDFESYTQNNSMLGGHCDDSVPGIEAITGSLGHGLGLACGMALAAKLDGKKHRVYAICGDGESQEGSVWEAIMFAAHHKLNNLTLILDNNNLGSEDYIENTCNLYPLYDKFKAFNWNVHTINGHDMREVLSALQVLNTNDKPSCIIAQTIKGNGLDTLQNTPKSHHTLPNAEQISRIRESMK